MTSRRSRRKLARTAASRAELARRERRNEERGRRVVEERERLGLTEEVYDRFPAAAKARILELEARIRAGM